MYAIVFEYRVAPDDRAAFAERFAAFLAVREQQPGFHGTIELAADDGRILGVNLWASREAQQAAQPAMLPTYEPARALLATGTQVLGTGAVARDSSAPGATCALLVANTFAPGQPATQAQAAEYRALTDRQPGARGAIFVAADDGTLYVLRLWESEAHQRDAAPALHEAFDRLVAPQLAAPMRQFGIGPIVRDTVTGR
jgi:heme-degrading monooxygenase HmoA